MNKELTKEAKTKIEANFYKLKNKSVSSMRNEQYKEALFEKK